MPELITDILQSLPPWALALAVAVLAMLVMLLLKRLILVRIGKLIEQTPFQIDTLLVHALRLPLTLLVICLGLLVYRLVLSQLGDEAGALSASVNQGLQLLLILAIVLFADRFLSGLLGNYAQRSSALANSRSIVQGISHGVIYGIGLLVLLGTMGISVTPIVASLGITSLAVALALQPTLENFFSGVQLVIDKPIRVGDFIELESGEQGFVDHIGWRSTWIRMLPNNTVIMPNSVLSQSKIKEPLINSTGALRESVGRYC
jgi:small-conductance mechanosensitive channel